MLGGGLTCISLQHEAQGYPPAATVPPPTRLPPPQCILQEEAKLVWIRSFL